MRPERLRVVIASTLYSVALTVVFIIVGPYFLYRALTTGKYIRGFRQRFGAIPRFRSEGKTIWIHAVSVGEVLAIQPVVEALIGCSPRFHLIISTITDTGQDIARSRYGQLAEVVYFPFDWRFAVRRAIKAIQPSLVLVAETEIWPNFLLECERQGIPTMLISGRISQRSFRRYRLIKPLVERVLNCFTFVLVQHDGDAERILTLGVPPARVVVTGDLKWDAAVPEGEAQRARVLDQLFCLSETQLLIVAGSTTTGEESIVVEAYKLLIEENREFQDARLVIAPRRPERFDEVERIVRDSGFRYARRTRAERAKGACGVPVILLDSIGELAALYTFARVVFVGESLFIGGCHNVFEPLRRGARVIVGGCYGVGGVDVGRCVNKLSDVRSGVNQPLAKSELDEVTRELAHTFASLLREKRCTAEHLVQTRQLEGPTVKTLKYVHRALLETVGP